MQREQYVIARNTLADIQQRHLDILKLTQSIRELHQVRATAATAATAAPARVAASRSPSRLRVFAFVTVAVAA